MTTDIDTLATALYVKTDDLLRAAPQLAPWRPKIGFGPTLTDAELVTLAVMQALLGFTSEAQWLRHARKHLTHLFRYLPQQSGYNKRLRAAAGLVKTVIRVLATDTTLWTDDVWVPPVSRTASGCGRRRSGRGVRSRGGRSRPGSGRCGPRRAARTCEVSITARSQSSLPAE